MFLNEFYITKNNTFYLANSVRMAIELFVYLMLNNLLVHH